MSYSRTTRRDEMGNRDRDRGRGRGRRLRRTCVAHGVLVAVAVVVAVVVAAWWRRRTTRRVDDIVVAIASTIASSASREDVTAWLAYHRRVGVGRFYIHVDGALPRAMMRVVRARDVRAFDGRRARAEASKLERHPSLTPYTTSTCGARALFVRQTLFLERALIEARADGVHWLAHVDIDELMYPSARRAFDVRATLADVPRNVTRVIFPNHEAVPERANADVARGCVFRSTTLFKRNPAHVDAGAYRKFSKLASNGHSNYFLAYANGKSAVRVNVSGVRPHGAHRFKTAFGREITHNEAAILHFPFVDAARALRRVRRCDCPPDAVANCSMLGFDIELRQHADAGTVDFEKFFKERVEAKLALTRMLCKAGLYVRNHAPMLVLKNE